MGPIIRSFFHSFPLIQTDISMCANYLWTILQLLHGIGSSFRSWYLLVYLTKGEQCVFRSAHSGAYKLCAVTCMYLPECADSPGVHKPYYPLCCPLLVMAWLVIHRLLWTHRDHINAESGASEPPAVLAIWYSPGPSDGKPSGILGSYILNNLCYLSIIGFSR